jgi:hypothetical protein
MGRRYLFTRLPAWRQKWGVPSRRASRQVRVAGGGIFGLTKINLSTNTLNSENYPSLAVNRDLAVQE